MNMATKISFVFPGQGSQSVGMLAGFSEQAIVTRTFKAASDRLGYDLWSLMKNGPESKLNQTEYTQPALLTAGVAVWRLWRERHETLPVMLAGHSLGEYTALVCADALPLEAAVSLVAERGRLMQQAVPEGVGAMAAILGLSDESLNHICQEVAQEDCVAPANYNCPGQVVIAGHKAAVERVIQAAKLAGAKRAILLPVSVPSHCALMKPAAIQFAERLETITFQSPSIPVLHNVDLCAHQTSEDIRRSLSMQLYSPVRWAETIQKMEKSGIEAIFECGPGSVLSGLNKRIVPNLQCAVLVKEEAVCL
jgi:[acyl-carrier-protein] S-malonyltransferase